MSLRKEKEMSCEQCEELQKGTVTSYIRWGIANIEVRACETHLKEIYDVINKAQAPGYENGGGMDSKYGNLNITGIPSAEPVFVLRAQDAHALYLLREYQALVSSHNPEMEEKMDLVLRRFKAWEPKKLPD
jgi:hypothetical protein